MGTRASCSRRRCGDRSSGDRDSQRSAEDSLEEYEAFGTYTHDPNGIYISCHAARQIVLLLGSLANQRRACSSDVRKPWEDPGRSSDRSAHLDPGHPNHNTWCGYI
ncbi:hypothetical protein PIB30_031929 [Stylosanthes scabra]|uniref:Uncharacterized protein n=1 Tax=Stylosanthes scabra TaxID=79078 RepID=A0ABU6Z8V3_9FABA|nr:hypothetical protein [Stylosanthes scabra]